MGTKQRWGWGAAIALGALELGCLLLGACSANTTSEGDAGATSTSSGAGGNAVECTTNLSVPVTGDVFDKNGTKLKPDRVVVSVGGIESECMIEFGPLSYGCGEQGIGTYEVTVTVQGHTMTQGATIRTQNQCHVTDSQKLDFTFDFVLSDASQPDA